MNRETRERFREFLATLPTDAIAPGEMVTFWHSSNDGIVKAAHTDIWGKDTGIS